MWVGLQCVIVVFPGHSHLLFVENRFREQDKGIHNEALNFCCPGQSSKNNISKNYSALLCGISPCVCVTFPIWCLRSGVVLDCIDS